MLASGDIVTDIKLAHKAICCGTIRTLAQRYLKVNKVMIPWSRWSLKFFEIGEEKHL